MSEPPKTKTKPKTTQLPPWTADEADRWLRPLNHPTGIHLRRCGECLVATDGVIAYGASVPRKVLTGISSDKAFTEQWTRHRSMRAEADPFRVTDELRSCVDLATMGAQLHSDPVIVFQFFGRRYFNVRRLQVLLKRIPNGAKAGFASDDPTAMLSFRGRGFFAAIMPLSGIGHWPWP